jgi:cobalt-zinc-cadmium efflux system membrane fusion protein
MKKLFHLLLFCGIFLFVINEDIGLPLSIASDAHDHDHDRTPTINENCEHNVPIIECDGCRYEVGVVKVDAEFLKEGMIELTEVRASTLGSIIEAPGEIHTNPDREVHITPRIPGVIKKVYKGLGDEVKAGEIVALLDSIELGQAKADYLKAKAIAALTGKNYNRVKSLSEKKIVSQKTFIEAESAFERARIELLALTERLHLLGLKRSDVQQIREHEEFMSLLPITASVNGIVIEKHAVIGERVDPSVVLFRAADLSHLWVWFDIYEKDLAKVKKGQGVSLSVLAYPEEKFEGQITYIGDMVSEKTRTTKVRTEVDNTTGKLKPGMFVTVTVHLGGKGKTLTVPKDSVQSDGTDKIVFVPLKENYFIKKKVILGTVTPEYYEVLSGLKESQKVVTKGSFLLKSELQKEQFGKGCAH